MQLHLQFSGAIRLPMAHRYYIQSMIYDALRWDPVYSAALHDKGSMPDRRNFKLFTFSELEGSYTIEGAHILFPKGARLEIRSIYEEFIWRLFRSFVVGSQIRIGNNTLTVSECTCKNEIIQQDILYIRTKSPIVAYITEENGHTRFFSPDEPSFYSLLDANARRKWQAVYHEEITNGFSLKLAPCTDCRKQVTTYKSTRITAWHGQFLLSGDPAMLNLLYHTGLGSKSSQGFGMFCESENIDRSPRRADEVFR